MRIKYQNLEKLTRWEVYQLLADAIAFAEAAKDGKGDLYLAVLIALQNKFKIFDEALVQEKATSSVLPDAEERRDYGVRKLYALASEYADFRVDAAKETAAAVILAAFKPYGTGSEIARMAQDAETGVLTNLLQDFRKESVTAALQTLGLVPVAELIEANNQQFGTERLVQTEEKARFVAGAVKIARAEAQEAFRTFCETVNALIIVEGAEKYEMLVPQINTRIQDGIATAKQRVERSRTEKLKKTDAEATQPETE